MWCYWCGITLDETTKTKDHLIPRAYKKHWPDPKLGVTVDSCWKCNQERGIQMCHDWEMYGKKSRYCLDKYVGAHAKKARQGWWFKDPASQKPPHSKNSPTPQLIDSNGGPGEIRTPDLLIRS